MRVTRAVASVLVIATLFASSFTSVYAVEDQFEIDLTVTGGADVTAPSVPAGVTATALSQTQIQVSWSASTDNVAVTGYEVFRDSVFIATTTSLSLTDFGLAPSTLYAYQVRAFDAALNYSALSLTASATTLAPVPPSTPGTPGQGGQSPVIFDVRIIPGLTSVEVTWRTTEPASSLVRWGLTSSYELGGSFSPALATVHSRTITGLVPGTRYELSLTAADSRGRESSVSGLSARTLDTVPFTVPNASDLRATPDTERILVSWNNPVYFPFESVRLVRSDSFYPSDPTDGEIVYEGRGEVYEDVNVKAGTRYFYALFVKDDAGRFSSGVIADARIAIPGEPAEEPVDQIDTRPDAPSVHPLIASLTFRDFDFIQDGRKLFTSASDSVSIDGSQNLTVVLDARKLPEVLKSIVVTLEYPGDATRTFSFLLRINEDKTAYTATIAPLGVTGRYGARIGILDYRNQSLKRITGSLFAGALMSLDRECEPSDSFKADLVDMVLNVLLAIFVLLALAKAIRLIVSGRRKKNPVPTVPASRT